jgi:hypothetical protein
MLASTLSNVPVDVPVLPDHIDRVNQVAQLVFTVGQIPPMLICFYLAYRYCKAYGTWLPWLILLGGLLMSTIEPIVDKNGLVWFPVDGQWSAFSDYGVTLPIWLVLGYVWFFGGRAMYIWHCLEQGRGTDRSFMFKNWGIIVLIDVVLENVGLYLGVFLYYGNQPLQIGKFPLWWAAINSATPIILGAAVFVLRPRLSGWRMLLVIPLAPAVCAGANAAVGWITWDALNNTDVPSVLVQLAGCVTVLFSLLLVALTRWFVEQSAQVGLVSLDGSKAPRIKRLLVQQHSEVVPAMAGTKV